LSTSDEDEDRDETGSAEPLPLDYLPWHAAARDRLQTAISGGRLPHGLLLHGPEGVGKARFAAAFAAAMFCRRRGDDLQACGACPDCTLSQAGTQPDLHWVRLLTDEKKGKDRKAISVDQVRELTERLGKTSLRGGYRIAIIAAADLMNVAAQNALLKTLEEPAPQTLLVLVTSRPSRLLATLRSRCQRVEIPRPDAMMASQWLTMTTGGPPAPGLLALAGGAPLKALALAPHYPTLEADMGAAITALLGRQTDVSSLAESMQGEGLPVRLDWLENWLGQVLRKKLLPVENPVTVPGNALLQRASGAVNITAGFRMLDRLREARRLLEGSASPPLVVEALLVELRTAFGR